MRLDRAQAEALLTRLRGTKVGVLGDLMLDEYLFGEVTRISPEAPVPVVRVVRERWVLGGAANVAANLKAIGAEPVMVGCLREDPAGRRLMDLLGDHGIETTGIVLDPQRPTIIKTRVIGQQQQMLRIDREEDGHVGEETVERLRTRLEKELRGVGALVVSDYAKGVVNPALLTFVRAFCQEKGIPWIVDPKPAHREMYRGATLMTPNLKELAELSRMPVKSDDEVIHSGRKLTTDLELGGLLVTRSEKGMALFAPDTVHKEPWLIPTEAREVFDVSGAGDTVIAVFSAAVGAGGDWKDAAMLANAAAGVVVGKMGTATATPGEILGHYQDQSAI